jgi:hypothetical protein
MALILEKAKKISTKNVAPYPWAIILPVTDRGKPKLKSPATIHTNCHWFADFCFQPIAGAYSLPQQSGTDVNGLSAIGFFQRIPMDMDKPI